MNLHSCDTLHRPRPWRAYFALCVMLALANLMHAASGSAALTPTRLLGIGFGLIALLPLFGYVFQRPMRPKGLWFAVFAGAIAITAVMLTLAIVHLSLYSLLAIPAIALALPYLLALRQYLYDSPHIWLARE